MLDFIVMQMRKANREKDTTISNTFSLTRPQVACENSRPSSLPVFAASPQVTPRCMLHLSRTFSSLTFTEWITSKKTAACCVISVCKYFWVWCFSWIEFPPSARFTHRGSDFPLTSLYAMYDTMFFFGTNYVWQTLKRGSFPIKLRLRQVNQN